MIFYINYIKDNDKTQMGNVKAERYELTTLRDEDLKLDVIVFYKKNEEVGRFNGKNIVVENVEDTTTLININIETY